jgi:hypothetical protein
MFSILPGSKNVTGFYVSEGQGEEQNPDPENDDVHGARSLILFIFALYVANLRPLVLFVAALDVAILRPAGLNHTETSGNDDSRHQIVSS